MGTFKNAKTHIDSYNDKILYDGGVCLSVANDAVEIYFPLFTSKGVKQYNDDNELTFGEQIRFVINLRLLNPLYLRNQIKR